MRRPLLVGALAAAVITLVASVGIVVGTLGGPNSGLGGPNSGPSTMRGYGQGPWAGMSGGSGRSMMGSMGVAWLPGDGVAVSSIPAARARAATAATPAGLRPGEVMWFDNGFYVELKDGAGAPATEVIVDPRTGTVSTEPGPAMMWNTSFGMRAGSGGDVVDSTKAREIANSWLAANRAGTTIAGIDAYPGYFTMDLQRNGAVIGMMSVRSVGGAVWYHTWHGAFIAMEDS